MKSIKKAVFPVAGLGSRFLPATKAIPKEMLPVVDKPLIQYAVEEAIAAGCTQMIFVTSSSKRTIEDHFDTSYELETRLAKQDKQSLLSMINQIIPRGIDCIYVRQPEPRGLGDAILCAKHVVGDEPFAILLADDLFDCGPNNCLQQMQAIYEKKGGLNLIAVEEIEPKDFCKFGVVGIDHKEKNGKSFLINSILEKPSIEKAPSNLGVAGRYILSPEIFPCLEKISAGLGGEIQLTDAISLLIKKEPVAAFPFFGKRYDCGSKLGYLQACIAYGCKHPEIGAEFRKYLESV